MKTLLITPTYGRIRFLSRLLASFLSQTHKDKNLIIINDDKNITLECNYKNVICLNFRERLSVSEKRNIGVLSGDYDLYLPHDDDDIFLPNKIKNSIEKHLQHNVDLYHNSLSYSIYGDEFLESNSTINNISFTKKGWEQAGGYKKELIKGEDAEFLNSVKNKLIEQDKENIDMVYNYGNINYHLSCSSLKNIDEAAEKELKELNLYGKIYKIEPNFEKYKIFLRLEEIYKKERKPIKVKHISFSNITL